MTEPRIRRRRRRPAPVNGQETVRAGNNATSRSRSSGISHSVCTEPVGIQNAAATETSSSETDRPGEYEVGYKKPPRHSRFKEGKSGNPRGRPKGSKNLKTELAEELQERVALREAGERRVVSKQRAMLKRLMEKALQGDARSASLIINMVARFLDETDEDERSVPLTEDDRAILDALEARIRATPE